MACRSGEVVASAKTYDGLIKKLEKMGPKWEELIIEFVERPDTVSVY